MTWTRQLAGARSGGSVQPTGQTHPGPPAAWSSSARCRKRLDRGSATAELAAALPVIVLLLLFGLTAVAALTTKLTSVDAAREAARIAARGGDGVAAGQAAAPKGAAVSVHHREDAVVATVRAPVPLLGARLPGFAVTASAVAAVEPGPPEPPP